jgi:hypothetical protein
MIGTDAIDVLFVFPSLGNNSSSHWKGQPAY